MPVLRSTLWVTALAFASVVSTAGAQVTFDPGSASGKQYSIPQEVVRAEGAGTTPKQDSSPRQGQPSAPRFGVGITPVEAHGQSHPSTSNPPAGTDGRATSNAGGARQATSARGSSPLTPAIVRRQADAALASASDQSSTRGTDSWWLVGLAAVGVAAGLTVRRVNRGGQPA